MEKVFQALIVIILFAGIGSAIDTFEQNSEIDIKHPIRFNGAVVPNVDCNISVYYPNNTILVDYLQMTDNGDYFNYTLDPSQTTLKGNYFYTVSCTNVTSASTESFEFLINLGGIEPSEFRTSSSTRVVFIFFGVGLLFFIGLFFVKSTPIKFTFFLLMFWFLLMGVNASYISIQDEVINKNLEGFFSFFLVLGFWANWAITISIGVIWMIAFIISILERKKIDMKVKYGI